MLADALLAVRDPNAALNLGWKNRTGDEKEAAVARGVDREKKDEEAVLGRRGRDDLVSAISSGSHLCLSPRPKPAL